MAKSKKTAAPGTPSSTPAAETTPPVKEAAAAKPAKPAKPAGKKKAAAEAAAPAPAAPSPAAATPASTPAAPVINTSLAAATAARLVGAKVALPSTAGPESKKESSTFKQLKQSVTGQQGGGIAGLLNSTTSPAAKKSNLPFGGSGKQTGRNQTFGSDASRTNVPRRTGG